MLLLAEERAQLQLEVMVFQFRFSSSMRLQWQRVFQLSLPLKLLSNFKSN